MRVYERPEITFEGEFQAVTHAGCGCEWEWVTDYLRI
jgi:hypothetical protein